jgi:hypothetical protein
MNIKIETKFSKAGVLATALEVNLDTGAIQTIEKNEGVEAANLAIDKFLHRLSNDVKSKLVDILK